MIRYLTFSKVSPTLVEGELLFWNIAEDKEFEEGTILYKVQGDKSISEVEAMEPGILRKILKKEGEICQVGKPIAIISDKKNEDISRLLDEYENSKKKIEQEKLPKKEEKEPTQPVSPVQKIEEVDFPLAPPLEKYTFPFATNREIRATPYAKKLALEKKVDLSTVKGSGLNGLIIGADIERALSSNYQKYASHEPLSILPGTYEEIPLSPMRKTIAKRLQQAKQQIPHFYVTIPASMAKVVDLRTQLKEASVSITINDFIVRAAALALRDHPTINAGFSQKNQTIVRFKTVDIAVAVALPDGLITPIIRMADRKNLEMLSTEIKLLAKRAKEGDLQPEEYQGGSFTISNLGMFGVENFLPIINPPQVAILGVSGIINHEMKLTVAADHRALDGADVANFLNTLKQLLENPAVLLL